MIAMAYVPICARCALAALAASFPSEEEVYVRLVLAGNSGGTSARMATLDGVEAGVFALEMVATCGIFLGKGIVLKSIERLQGPLFWKTFTARAVSEAYWSRCRCGSF